MRRKIEAGLQLYSGSKQFCTAPRSCSGTSGVCRLACVLHRLDSARMSFDWSRLPCTLIVTARTTVRELQLSSDNLQVCKSQQEQAQEYNSASDTSCPT
jgi:hypothetical protein